MPPEHPRLIAAGIPGARLVTLDPGGAHGGPRAAAGVAEALLGHCAGR